MSEVTQAVASGAHRTDARASSNMDPHGDFHVPMSTYVLIFVALMVLLVVTVAAAFVDLGAANMPVAMLIASIKAALVILYFMHVKYSSRLTKVFVAASFLWLAILFVMTFADYISRDWLSNSRGWHDNPVVNEYDAGTRDHGHSGDAKHGASPEGTTEDKAPGRPGAG
jgi:cytochrome c oxidase subunit 4